MGNEKSQPAGLVVEENAIEVADRWALHSAIYSGVSGNPKISVFIGPTPFQNGQNLLEKCSKNLMLYRHPCILKYITTWQKSGKLYLATEGVKPLVQALPSQTALQVCIGLQSVLKALTFLHDKALSSHNNVCRAAIYVAQDGSWKLGGLEYLCRFSELSSGYLTSTRVGRYDAGISPCEQDRLPQPLSSVDCFAFGVLAEEVLSAFNADDVPGMQEFKDLCKTQLCNTQASLRPPLNSLLNITFFTHKFINIHNFLTELTLKTDIEKQDFFRGLSHKLSMFEEEIVASQLGTLLLSRMVLLDTTAQQHFLPSVFVPRTSGDVCCGKLFSEKTFRSYLVPKLLPMFCVRDAHVRLILLTHFSSFCSMFSATQLKTRILPELLVGIKDTNDTLVSCTLRALADIVPILGSSVVIGGKSRRKFFADGRPKAAAVRLSSKNHGHRSSNVMSSKSSKQNENETGSSAIYLPERASPDGGEDLNSPNYTASEEETENWTDWENNAEDMSHNDKDGGAHINRSDEREIQQDQAHVIKGALNNEDCASKKISSSDNEMLSIPSKIRDNHKNSLPDITTLDIKISKTNNGNKQAELNKTSNSSSFVNNLVKEVDYFQDMEPVIVSCSKHNIDDMLSLSSTVNTNSNRSSSKFEINDQDTVMNEIEGWGDDDDDNWNIDDDCVNVSTDNCKNDT
ncbi:protein-associating with the carboxyl-terminal domain of ezrin [Lycorma delicatula]|uniref:protein-associating with the carboxyl-terminal domain of ezrin n=1 Tax=Lycorma delicatula TaxID=130591 RepID=UPI003F51AAA2